MYVCLYAFWALPLTFYSFFSFIQSNSKYTIWGKRTIYFTYLGVPFSIYGWNVKFMKIYYCRSDIILDENNKNRERERERGCKGLKRKRKKNWRVRTTYCFENLTLRLFYSSYRYIPPGLYILCKSLEGSWNFHFTLTIQFGSCISNAITGNKFVLRFFECLNK